MNASIVNISNYSDHLLFDDFCNIFRVGFEHVKLTGESDWVASSHVYPVTLSNVYSVELLVGAGSLSVDESPTQKLTRQYIASTGLTIS